MTIKTILKATEKFVTDNSPGILTGLAVAGAVTTAVLTGKASFQAAKIIQDEWDAENMGNEEKFHLTWKLYIPAAVTGAATITCIVAANRIGTRRTAAIAAAFKLSEQLTDEYKNKVVKTLGAQKEEKMRSELAAERMERAGGADQIIIIGSEVVFLDELSGRFFKHEMEKIKAAVNEINYQVNNNYFASLSDFYDKIGLDHTEFSDEFGWNTDELLDPVYSATLLKDGRPAIAISYNKTPIRDYDRCQ
jgi:low affinity Fe/Cu permease